MHSKKKAQLPSIGILTIIGPEQRAVMNAFGITSTDRVFTGDGTLSFAKEINNAHTGPIEVLVWAIGTAGNTASAADSAKLIAHGVKFLLLCGIAGGMETKVKIGDIVIPRTVVDTTVKVVEDGDLKHRPIITALLKGVNQMNCAVEIEPKKLHAQFVKLKPNKIAIPKGQEEVYEANVTAKPTVHESAILTDNLLVRDPSILIDAANDLHQQIRATEMEAGGMVHVCMNEFPPIPWFVVRGISDLGDSLKNDLFHDHAAKAAAAYVYLYVTEVLDFRIWHTPLPAEEPVPSTPSAFLQEMVSQVESNNSSLNAGRFPALNKAFTVTFAYLSQLSIPDASIDPFTRVQLSILWHNAANEVRSDDPLLYGICFKKSGYWTDPSRWNEQQIKDSGFSYADLLEKLQKVGFGQASASNEWPFTVEFDDLSLDNHIIFETVSGQCTNSVAPTAMNTWEINKAISNIVRTPEIIKNIPSFLLGNISVRVDEMLYRKWRQNQDILLDSSVLRDEVTKLKAELPLGERALTASFKPSTWKKLNKANENGDTLNFDIEMPDGSLCVICAEVSKIDLKEERADGTTVADLTLMIETSDRLFTKYKCAKRVLCHCAPVEHVRASILDALSELGWTGSYKDFSGDSVFHKQTSVMRDDKQIDVLFEAAVKLEYNGSKSVVKIEVSEQVAYCLTQEVSDLARSLAESITKKLH